MMPYSVHLTLKSRNAKTGPIPVSTTTRATCPDSCPFKANGCYAESGPLAIHWRKVTQGLGMSWQAFCDAIESLPAGQLWRHNQAGDLPGQGETIDRDALSALVQANKGKRGFTYTHKPLTAGNQQAIKDANEQGFTINLSANSLAHADKLASLGIAPVTVVLPHDAPTATQYTPQGRKVVVCPATYRDNVSCASCKLCAVRDRDCIVGFPAHGTSKRKASTIATGA